MKVELISQIKKEHSLVFVVNKDTQPSVVIPEIQQSLQSFKDSDKDFDFIKTSENFVFFAKEQNDLEKMRVSGFSIRQQLSKECKEIAVIGEGEPTLALVEGFCLSNYQFLKYFKDADEKEYQLDTIGILGNFATNDIDKINHIIRAVYWARDMVNEPVSYLDAIQLAKEIQEISNEVEITTKTLDKAAIENLKMGGLLAVNQGSITPPTFTIMEYKPENPINKKPIVLVGKGVVYDTGGLSLKPTAGSMDTMKSDMGGAACMAGTIYAAALNKLNVHIITLIPATDNRPGGNAYAPGDVVKMYDGTTVEVLNTDAEGRMILADAIAYANQYEPELIINAATLTGAALIAAGTRAICMMSNANDEVNNLLISSGYKVYERLVHLPLWDDYKEQLKSTIADMKNIGGRTAGTITAGKFLEHFAKFPFVHLDIAGPAFNETPENYKGNGASGVGIRLLIEFLSNYQSK